MRKIVLASAFVCAMLTTTAQNNGTNGTNTGNNTGTNTGKAEDKPLLTLTKVLFTKGLPNEGDGKPEVQPVRVVVTLKVFDKETVKLFSKYAIKNTTEGAQLPEVSLQVVESMLFDQVKDSAESLDARYTKENLFENSAKGLLQEMVIGVLANISTLNNVDRSKIVSVFKFNPEIKLYYTKDSEKEPKNKKNDSIKVESLLNERKNAGTNVMNPNQTNAEYEQQRANLNRQLATVQPQIMNVQTMSTGVAADILDKQAELGRQKNSLANATRADSPRIQTNINNLQQGIASDQRKRDSLRAVLGQLQQVNNDALASLSNIQNGSGINEKHTPFATLKVASAELVIHDGFTQTLTITLEDKLKLDPLYGGGEEPITNYGIRKTQVYHFSLDLRSVAFAQAFLNRWYAINQEDRVKTDVAYWQKLGDFINYTAPQDGDITHMFVAKNQRIFFNGKEPKVTELAETDVNTVIKLNLFTDVVGVLEDQPNGLLQAEGTFYVPFVKANNNKRFKIHKAYYLDHLEANFRIAKIENKLRFLELQKPDKAAPRRDSLFVPSFQLLQYANVDVGVKFSLVKFESYKRIFNFYFSTGIVRTGVRDTLLRTEGATTVKVPDNYNLLSWRASIMPHYRVYATSYTGVDISCEFTGLKLLNRDVLQSGGAYFRDSARNQFSPYRYGRNIIINPQFQVYYMPGKDDSKRIYFRASFVHDIATRSNNFLMLQFGYKADINKFLNFNKTTEERQGEAKSPTQQ